MKFFFPDSHDLVDPSFDFATERRSETRVRHQDDQYAHEVFQEPPYSGVLVSKAIVDGSISGSGKYSTPQRQRLLRVGIREFFRFASRPLESMGDCGAFNYVRENVPPYTVDEVIDFYLSCEFDYGVSVDHIILAFYSAASLSPQPDPNALAQHTERREITIELARDFLKRHKKERLGFRPVGVAQGWSAESYAKSVKQLQAMGYDYIGIGGLVPLKTEEIMECLRAIKEVRNPKTKFHLFGVNRCDHLDRFAKLGVASFDSTSPLLQAFKHDRENYYTESHRYSAIRVPQSEGNARLEGKIRAGQVQQEETRRLEKACLSGLVRWDKQGTGLKQLLEVLREYDIVHDGRKDRTELYRKTLEDRPWKKCNCDVCRQLGIHVVIFRGAERNRRRGFHNLYVVYHQFHRKGARSAIA